jgi:hypothetical protein
MKWQLPLAIVAALFLGSLSTTSQAADAEKGKGKGFPGKFEKGKGRPQAGKGGPGGKGGFGRGPGGPGGAGKAEFLKRFDKDGDGQLSDAEKQAIREAFANRKKDKK